MPARICLPAGFHMEARGLAYAGPWAHNWGKRRISGYHAD